MGPSPVLALKGHPQMGPGQSTQVILDRHVIIPKGSIIRYSYQEVPGLEHASARANRYSVCVCVCV
jgi:hypothetical protein